MNKLRIVFMGTPEFATYSLKKLVNANYNIVGVVTTPDKPAGRGQKISESDVKKYAKTLQIPILQPQKLKSEAFIEELKALKADLQIVVAFRMLPEVVWNMPQYGTLNLHASLLPQYRGAAPINHAIINGETKTGVTTFFIEKDIDTGNIIYNQEVEIAKKDTAGTLHDKLMKTGAGLLLKTVDAIANKNYPNTPQSAVQVDGKMKPAPKIFKNDCKIDWQQNTQKLYNFIRGLSPYPAAWTKIETKKDNKQLLLKIFECQPEIQQHNLPAGTIVSDNKTEFKVASSDGFIHVKMLQLQGRKQLKTNKFLTGIKLDSYQPVLIF